MRLGGSLGRRRGGAARSRKSAPATRKRAGKRAAPVGSLWLKAAGLALLGWAGGYFVATQFMFPAPAIGGDLVEVPDVRNVGTASAGERLAGAGLVLGDVDSLQHPSVPAGLIIGQSPLPGQIARPESLVRITISVGPQRRSVPDVSRLDAARARVVLETSGFVVQVDSIESDQPRGRVLDHVPAPESVVALPAEIRLIVSTGPPVILMPLVLGIGEDEATRMLDSLGLRVSEIREVFRFGRDQGIVVEQEPAADTELMRGEEVRLSVGRRGRESEGRREQ